LSSSDGRFIEDENSILRCDSVPETITFDSIRFVAVK